MNAPRTIRQIPSSELADKTFKVVKKSREELHAEGQLLPGRYITDAIRTDMSLVLNAMTPTGEEGDEAAHEFVVTTPVDSIQVGQKGALRVYTQNDLYELTPVEREQAA